MGTESAHQHCPTLLCACPRRSDSLRVVMTHFVHVRHFCLLLTPRGWMLYKTNHSHDDFTSESIKNQHKCVTVHIGWRMGCIISKSPWSYHETAHSSTVRYVPKSLLNHNFRSLRSLSGVQVWEQNVGWISPTDTNSVLQCFYEEKNSFQLIFFICFCCLIYWRFAK